LRPASGSGRNDFTVAGAFTRPTPRFEILFEDIDRSAVVALILFGQV
jgi:hypothetical protein